MHLHSLTLIASLLAASTFCAAGDSHAATGSEPRGRLTVPYAPGEDVQQAFDTTNEWVEVYEATAMAAAEAIGRVIDRGTAPANGLAYFVAGRLYLKFDDKVQALPAATSRASRGDRTVQYAATCGDYPRPRDRLLTTFGPVEGYSVEVDARVSRYVAYAKLPVSDKLIPMNAADTKQCHRITHKRLFLTGTLKLMYDGRAVETRSVLLQSLQEP